MSKKEKNIDSLFKKQLDEFECSPTDASWKFLKMRMTHSALKKRLFLMTSSALVFVIGVLSFYIFKNENATIRYKQANNNNSLFIDSVGNFELRKETLQMAYRVNNQEHEIKSKLNSQTELNKLKDRNIPLNFSESKVHTSIKKAKTDKAFLIQKNRISYLNSAYDDYAPVIKPNANFIYFTSRRPITKKETRKGKGKERIYYAEREGGNWTTPKLAKTPLNSENNFNSAVSLSQNGQTLFIYRDDYHGNGDIFASSLKNGTWSVPEALPEPINSEHHESTISMSSDGNKLFFTSNRPGGQGGLDIWYTEKNKSGIWGEAKNLGANINSDQHEEGLFLHPNDKTLFFSSRRAGGFGGYDIYFTSYENGKWSKPTNLGSQINTENDDVYFMLDLTNNEAFLSSSNQSSGNKELFTLGWNDAILNLEKTPNITPTIKGEIDLINNNTRLTSAISIYLLHKHQIISNEILEGKLAFEMAVDSEKDYELVILSEGFIPVFEEIEGKNIQDNFELNKNIQLLNLGEEISFIFKIYGQEEQNLKVIDKDFAHQIIAYLTQNTTLKIEIISKEDLYYLKHIFESAGANNQKIMDRLIFLESKDNIHEKQNIINITKTN